ISGVQERESITPDLTAMGKIIGGGLPVGAFGGRADVMDHLAPEGPVYQAGTLSGNPLAMAAGIAALSILEEENPYPRLAKMGARLAEGLSATAADAGIPLQMPQVGSMFCFFFSEHPVTNYEQAISTDAERFKGIFRHALDKGVYLPPSPYETCFLSAAHGDEEVDRTLEILAEGIRKI
ncbi:MAG: aminotransferase class III-fold pyridoxal phosphate-dependent enzyme, partial [Opitutales bacterium]